MFVSRLSRFGLLAGGAVLLLVASGCGPKGDESASGGASGTSGAVAPPTKSTNVPAEAAASGAGAQQMGAQRGGDAAANAAAFNAARAKAEGK